MDLDLLAALFIFILNILKIDQSITYLEEIEPDQLFEKARKNRSAFDGHATLFTFVRCNRT